MEKRVREVHQSFNQFEDTSDEANGNIVFAWQSGHRPFQQGITCLDGAFPRSFSNEITATATRFSFVDIHTMAWISAPAILK